MPEVLVPHTHAITWFSRTLLKSPARLSVFGFLALIALGTTLLSQSMAATGKALPLVDALFTSVSAVCVTGLIVTDTGSTFTPFGQAVVLALIQVGGLGIMTISTVVLLVARRRPSMAEQILIRDTFTHGRERSLQTILKHVILFTLAIEALGAMLMLVRFWPQHTPARALWLSVFHAISAFCNAGFSLFAQSFSAYREDLYLNGVLCLLIVTGGIGFLVISELGRQFSAGGRLWRRLSLHTKLVIAVTAGLIVGGALLIGTIEWRHTLSGLSGPGRIIGALFQSVTARTAGFNTLPIGDMANGTLFVLMLLMFIGASPGSCGGGIKTTTFATLLVLGLSRLRGRRRPQVFYRSISDGSVTRALSLALIGILVIITATLALLIIEAGETPHSQSRGAFLELMFEVISAFATVGLSTGVTSGLSTPGKLIVALVMFIGRLGPLVVALAISRQEGPRYHYAEENIMIG